MRSSFTHKVYRRLELKHRELEARILTTLPLVSSGIEVAFGQQWAMFNSAKSLLPGAILFKTVNDIQATNMTQFKLTGHQVAATDEEVLICTEDRCFAQAFGERAATNCDEFFAPNCVRKNAVESQHPSLVGKVTSLNSMKNRSTNRDHFYRGYTRV
jgi:hypothetical protein